MLYLFAEVSDALDGIVPVCCRTGTEPTGIIDMAESISAKDDDV